MGYYTVQILGKEGVKEIHVSADSFPQATKKAIKEYNGVVVDLWGNGKVEDIIDV